MRSIKAEKVLVDLKTKLNLSERDSKHLRRGQINNVVSASSAKPKGLEDRGGKISENDPRVLSMVMKQHYYLTKSRLLSGRWAHHC